MYSFISFAPKILNLPSYLITPTYTLWLSIVPALIIQIPSNPYFKVNKAVWIASSIYISSLNLFYKKTFAFFAFFPIAVAFHVYDAPDGSTWHKCGPF